MPALQSFFNWSGGKDSALALYHIVKNEQYSVKRLLTNGNSEYGRIAMHGYRAELLELQAAAMDILLHKLILTEPP